MSVKLEDVHEKGKRYDWSFDYARPDPKFPTRYIIPPKGKDPFRVMMRGYAAMETEKDNRVYGALDANVRYHNANVAEPRWVEAMKFAIPCFTDAEYQAVTGAGFLIASVKNQELRQGFAGADARRGPAHPARGGAAQVLPEELPRPGRVRHRPAGAGQPSRSARSTGVVPALQHR